MNNDANVARIHREMARWRILMTLQAGRPYPVSEHLLWTVIADLRLPMTQQDVRREMGYLEDKGLIAIAGKDTVKGWDGELTGLGVDVVEYTVPAPEGVGRPQLPARG